MSFYTYTATDAAGAVLYVGRATRREVWRRFAEHKERSGSEWMQKATLIRVAEHLTYGSMRRHEQELWELYSPPYNIRTPGTTREYSAINVIGGEIRYAKDTFGRWHEEKT